MKTKLSPEQIKYIKNTIEKDASENIDNLVDRIFEERQKEFNQMTPEELKKANGSDHINIHSEKQARELADNLWGNYKDQATKQINLAKEIKEFLTKVENNDLSKDEIKKIIEYFQTDMKLADSIYSSLLNQINTLINEQIKNVIMSEGMTEEQFKKIPQEEILAMADEVKKATIGQNKEISDTMKEAEENYKKSQEIVELLTPLLAIQR